MHCEYNMTIKESHLDTFGHVNNAVYLQILEEARWQWITDNGYGLEVVQATQKGPVILEVNLKFLAELKLREKIKIVSSVEPFTGLVGKIDQKIFNEKGVLAAHAVFAFGYFDLKLRKLIPSSPEWLKAIGLS